MSVSKIFRDFREWAGSNIAGIMNFPQPRGSRTLPKWIQQIPESKYPESIYFRDGDGKPPSWEAVFERYARRFLSAHIPGWTEILHLPPSRIEEVFPGVEVEISFFLGRLWERAIDIASVPVYVEQELRNFPREELYEIKNSYPIALPGSTYNKADGTDTESLIQEILRCQKILGAGESLSPRFLNPGDRVVVVIDGPQKSRRSQEWNDPDIERIAKAMAMESMDVIATVQEVAIVPKRGLPNWEPPNPVPYEFEIRALPIWQINQDGLTSISSEIIEIRLAQEQRIFRLL